MGILDSIGSFLGDEENRLNLASGFAGMSGNPNAGNIQQGYQNRLTALRSDRKLASANELEASKLERDTKRALQLLGEYPDIADAVRGGFLSPNAGVTEARKRKAAGPKSEGAAIDGYRLAQKQGYTGTWNEYKTAITKAGASVNTMTMGGSSVQAAKPDKGMQNITDAKGYISQVPIAGGIVDIDTQKQVSTAEQAVKVIDEALNHAGLSAAVGPWDARTPTMLPDAIAFEALHNQIKGKAFLQAFESLKGGGQITEVEGLKAEQAMARLEMAQDEADYKKALTDLKEIVEASMARNKGVLNSIPTSGQSSDNDPMGIR